MAFGAASGFSDSLSLAAFDDGTQFRRARDLAAWLGLVPAQNSTGGRTVLLGITKRGNRCVRRLLVHGARSCATHLDRSRDRLESWPDGLCARIHVKKVTVAGLRRWPVKGIDGFNRSSRVRGVRECPGAPRRRRRRGLGSRQARRQGFHDGVAIRAAAHRGELACGGGRHDVVPGKASASGSPEGTGVPSSGTRRATPAVTVARHRPARGGARAARLFRRGTGRGRSSRQPAASVRAERRRWWITSAAPTASWFTWRRILSAAASPSLPRIAATMASCSPMEEAMRPG